jgi:broad-specificity NMP kinase
VNLLKASNDAQAGAVDAYYSFKDKRITVRGHRVTPAVKSTLVHELTHVLQDQHFDVGARLKKLGKESEKGRDTSEASVLDAIVEGDAERVAHLYAASLGPRQRRALAASERAEVTHADHRTSQVPQVVMAMMSAPYTLGEGLVQTVAQEGGNAAVDRLLRHPPTHESALLDPFRVLTGRTSATKVDVPRLQAGEKEFESGELGVLTWYVTLAQRLPLPQALAAADGWGGDAYVGYQHDGTTCIRAAYTGLTTADTARMYTALQGWQAAAPSTAATVSRAGDVVRFQSCDPRDAADVGRDDSQEAINLAATRTGLAYGLMRSGLPQAGARCMAGRMAEVYSVAQLNDPTFGRDASVRDRLRQFAAECG